MSTICEVQEWNAHQRAAQVTIWLKEGGKLTTADIARRTCLTWDGAKYMMEMLSGRLPIVQIEDKWQWME